jgi:hypothetical protein
MKKITLILLLLFSITAFSQEYNIVVAPKILKNTSSIQISVKKTGNYQLKIIGPDGNKIFTKDIKVDDLAKFYSFKFNFRERIKGNYTFILLNRRGKILKELKINKTTK